MKGDRDKCIAAGPQITSQNLWTWPSYCGGCGYGCIEERTFCTYGVASASTMT